jgi:hypothetical protein
MTLVSPNSGRHNGLWMILPSPHLIVPILISGKGDHDTRRDAAPDRTTAQPVEYGHLAAIPTIYAPDFVGHMSATSRLGICMAAAGSETQSSAFVTLSPDSLRPSMT